MKHGVIFGLLACLVGTLSAADRVRYVDTGSAGGDGTTNAVAGANAAYVSLDACLVAEHAADSTLTDEGNLVIHKRRTNGGGADTATATILATWGTDATHRIVLVQDDFPADGIYDATKYVLQPTNASGLVIQDKYVTVGPLQVNPIQSTTGIARGININSTGASDILLTRCLIKGTCSGTGEGYGVYINDSTCVVKMVNCLITDIVSGADNDFRGVRSSSSTTDLYNCTIYNCRTGAYRTTAGTVTATNCAVGNNNDDFSTVTAVNCCSDDGDGTNPQAPASGDWANEFNNIAGGDFSLKTGGNCIGHGVDDPGSGLYTTDLIGTTRSTVWDIGAFEAASASPPAKVGSLSPAHQAVGQNINVDLSWGAADGATAYDVYFGTDSTPDASELVSDDQPGLTYDPGTLEYSTRYYWRIDSVNAAGTTTGDVLYYDTGAEPAAGAPPASGSRAGKDPWSDRTGGKL